MANFALKRGPSTRLAGLAIEDGAFIITTDTQELHADLGTARYSLGQILEVKALPEVADANLAKFYYLSTDKCIYKCVDGAWVNLSKSGVIITTGATNGTISVNGTEVAVFGLGTAAYKNVEDFDAAGAAKAVQGETEKTVAAVEAEAGAAQAAAEAAQKAADDLDASLKAVAKSGAAADVELADAGEMFNATNVEAALAELAGQIGLTGEAGKVTVDASDSADYAKVYDIKQNGVSVGTINIPKDMVVSSGEVVELAEGEVAGHAAGTYLKLVLANAAADTIYIAVSSLIEYVTGGSTAEIVVSVDPTTHVVTATIVDGSIAKAKLAADVQASLAKADSAMQKVTVLGKELAEGGELTAEEAKVALGLKSAAYAEASEFDAAGAADAAKAAVIGAEGDAAEAETVYGAKAYAKAMDDAMAERVAELEEAVGEGGSVSTQISTELGKLDLADTAQAGQYVSAVTQEDGQITVVRANLPDYTETYDAKGAAAAAQTAAVETAIGTADDGAEANTINGAKAYADEAVAEATAWAEF